MRTAFISTLTELAAGDPRITLVVGDLGFGVVMEFARRFPRQFVNAGVAEQNMTGLAAGLALSGRIVFTYSIANFPTLRCLEQIRNDVAYHGARVNVVAVGGGTAYGALGATHHATEDLAAMRSVPGLTVIAPGDPVETDLAIRAIVASGGGPSYLRLGRAGEETVHATPPDLRVGRAIALRDGVDVTLISTGGMLADTVRTADALAAHGVRAGVLSMHTLRPIDADAIVERARRSGLLCTVEEHSISGGLGSAVAEVMAEAGVPGARLLRLGFPDRFADKVGSQAYMRERAGLHVEGLVEAVRAAISSRPPSSQGAGQEGR